MSGRTPNRRRPSTDTERVVVLICTDEGTHPRRRLDTVAMRDGVAVSLETEGPPRIRRHYAESAASRPVSDFDLHCTQCPRRPQVTRGRMTELVRVWLADDPTRRRVVRDISSPISARWL